MASLQQAEKIFLSDKYLSKGIRTSHTEPRRERDKKTKRKLQQLHRLVDRKCKSQEYLPDLYKHKSNIGAVHHTLSHDDLQQVYNIHTVKFPMELKRKNPRRKYHNSQSELRPNSNDPLVLSSLHSSSAPAGLNLAAFNGYQPYPNKQLSQVPTLPPIRSESNLVAEHLTPDSPEDSEDVDPASKKMRNFQKALRQAEEEVKHNWLLESENNILMKKFSRRKNQLSIRLPDEDPLAAISRRLEEIQMMAKPRRDTRYVLDRIDPSKKELILVS